MPVLAAQWALLDLTLSLDLPTRLFHVSNSQLLLFNDLLCIFAAQTATNTGAAFFARVDLSKGLWKLSDTIYSPQNVAYSYFGISVSLYGDYMAVGNSCLRTSPDSHLFLLYVNIILFLCRG